MENITSAVSRGVGVKNFRRIPSAGTGKTTESKKT